MALAESEDNDRLERTRVDGAGRDRLRMVGDLTLHGVARAETLNAPGTVQVGELVVAAFDWAARFSADPKEVSRLATLVVMRVLQCTPAPTPRPGATTLWDEIEIAFRKTAGNAAAPPVAEPGRRGLPWSEPTFLRIEGKHESP